ncbi:hypothetical protein NOR_04182 [Metarhizium rileyi]|uniref:Cyclin-like F-box n=1 Tax=Metarhizium rileyi (strain RCEF 4871) TaxID=1649241 RepID=A0A167EAY1_METRR|nr:hypothetical protein NOR_04182 [Metarhizium rileyi RCEF 4871]
MPNSRGTAVSVLLLLFLLLAFIAEASPRGGGQGVSQNANANQQVRKQSGANGGIQGGNNGVSNGKKQNGNNGKKQNGNIGKKQAGNNVGTQGGNGSGKQNQVGGIQKQAGGNQKQAGGNQNQAGGNQNQAGGNQKAAGSQNKVSEARDGSMILEGTFTVGQDKIRFKVSGPASNFKQSSSGNNRRQNSGADGSLGINVLLHGDGGDSFQDFPNQGVNANLMGVALLAPNKERKWGGLKKGNQQRSDGVRHSQAVADIVQKNLPEVVTFNQSDVFFTGVSGGALTLSGFFMPAHMGKFDNTGFMLNCGALEPQVDFTDESARALTNTRVHFQTSQEELPELKVEIPAAIKAYEQTARDLGLTDQQINTLQTADSTPQGNHCAFDSQSFTSGVDLMVSNFENVILPSGNGQVNGIGNVNKGVVGNENLGFF